MANRGCDVKRERNLPPTSYFRSVSQTLLSDNWSILTRQEFDYRRKDGAWQRQVREVYDRGDGATCLLHNPDTDCFLLTRQFRLPIYNDANDGFLIETPAGLLEGAAPDKRMRAELEEETGYRISKLEPVFDVVMSPGSVTETVSCFMGTYSEAEKVSDGGGEADEGEDIEVLHIPFVDAMRMIKEGGIRDGKTILLIQQFALRRAGVI